VIGWLPVRQQGFGLTGLSRLTKDVDLSLLLRLGACFGGRSRQLLVVDEGALPFGPLCFLDHKFIQRQERLTCLGP
jgi:hypothetical protein